MLGCSNPLTSARSGARSGLDRELWAFPCWAAAPAGDHQSQSWGWARLVELVVPTGIHLG